MSKPATATEAAEEYAIAPGRIVSQSMNCHEPLEDAFLAGYAYARANDPEVLAEAIRKAKKHMRHSPTCRIHRMDNFCSCELLADIIEIDKCLAAFDKRAE